MLEKREEKRLICWCLTSDKGLAGAFNSNLMVEAEEFLKQKSENGEVRLTCWEKRPGSFFRRLEYPIERSLIDRIQKLTEQEIRGIANDQIRELYSQSDRCRVCGL